MNSDIVCDIVDCFEEATPREVVFMNTTKEPTGHNYGYYEHEPTIIDQVDMCKKHYEKFEANVANVLVRDSKGLYFPNESK